jgi:molybdopterin-guanine dinucleotide biosynthesis adapter protein
MRVFGFAGWSGSGKTTLIEALIPVLVGRGLVVSLIKHAHHGFDVDHRGKDSWRHRQAGCTEVLVSSPARWALMHELRGAPEPTFAEGLARLSPCDIVLLEGYKTTPIPKLEVWRRSVGKPMLHPDDHHIVALATDDRSAVPTRRPVLAQLPVFDLGDVGLIASFVLQRAAAWPPTN